MTTHSNKIFVEEFKKEQRKAIDILKDMLGDEIQHFEKELFREDKKKLARILKTGYTGISFSDIVFILISKAQLTPKNLLKLEIAFLEYVEMYNEWQSTKNEKDFFKKYGV